MEAGQYDLIDLRCLSISKVYAFYSLFFLLMSIFVWEESQGSENGTLTRAILVTVKCYIWKIPMGLFR